MGQLAERSMGPHRSARSNTASISHPSRPWIGLPPGERSTRPSEPLWELLWVRRRCQRQTRRRSS